MFDAAICEIIENPTGKSSSIERYTLREAANIIRLTPNPMAAIPISRPMPRKPLRLASSSAPVSAPTPVDAISDPSVEAPPPRICAANTGISTVYGMPTRLITPSSVRINRIGRVRTMKRNPSRMCSTAETTAVGRRLSGG